METISVSPTKTKREAALLVFVVFLLGLLVGAVGNHFYGESVWGGKELALPAKSPSRTQVLNDFTRELQLTPDQQAKVGVIIDETRAQVHALYAPLDAQHDQLRQQARARIRAILTPDQLPKFDQFMQRIDEQRKKAQSEH
jgi:Spy/CpxP family protein refolding chaperone